MFSGGQKGALGRNELIPKQNSPYLERICTNVPTIKVNKSISEKHFRR